MRSSLPLGLLAAIAVIGCVQSTSPAAEDIREQTHRRRPVAIVEVDGLAYVANRRSGSISEIDPSAVRVIREQRVGTGLADLDVMPDDKVLLAIDEDRLLIIDRSRLEVVDQLALPASPVDLCLIGPRRCSIASLWARKLSIVSFERNARGDAGSPAAAVMKTIELPFAPRKQILVDDSHLVVADAFGGQLAVIDLNQQTLAAVRSLKGHNIRGIAVSPNQRELLVTHQILDSKSTTTHESIFWGTLMSNVLHSIPLRELLSGETETAITGYLYPLGRPSNGTGDPADVLVTDGGQTVVALSGVDEVALRARPLEPFVRRNVGRLPAALAASASGGMVYIANTLDDSITLLDLSEMQIAGSVALGTQPELSRIDRGESLFYDARLSLDSWFSCHSCHTDGHTNGLLSDNLSDGHFGAPKRILSLRGTADTGPWAWSGSVGKLESQIRNSIELTMLGSDVTDEQIGALADFVRQLGTIPARRHADRAAVRRGKEFFEQRECANCHAPPTFTSASGYDVGLADEQGTNRFNPPSLRGVGHRNRLFHDNRAANLREVFLKFGHGHDSAVDSAEIDDLVAFLKSL